MSAGRGFFKVNFPNAETAKKAFEWANEHFDWMEDLEPFVVDGSTWVNNEDKWGEDGVDIKNTMPDGLEWLEELGKSLGIEHISGREYEDFSESSFDACGTVYASFDSGVFSSSWEPEYQDEEDDDEEDDDDEDEPEFAMKDGVLTKYNGSDSSVTIPESVTKINQSAFSGCTSLTSVTIHEGVSEIGERAFAGCTALASVTIPGSVTYIYKVSSDYRKNAFSDCTAIKEIRYGGTQAQWCFMLNGFKRVPENVSVRCSDGNAQPISKDVTEISIPEDVTKIGRKAFNDCTSLSSVTIPEGVTKIGDYAFENCTSLASVTIPASVTEIGGEAFEGCTSLKEIHYAGTKEQWAAVEKGDGWKKDVPAKEVLYTGGDAPEFEIADGVLTKYNGSSSAVTIPEGVKSIGKAAFYKCEALASVIIPDGVTEIGVCAFGGCTSLASVSIPGSVTKICEAAFNVCTALASVTIPGSVTEIGKGAFCGCTALAEIHFGGTKEQWAAVKKGDFWNEDVPAKEVLVRKQG